MYTMPTKEQLEKIQAAALALEKAMNECSQIKFNVTVDVGQPPLNKQRYIPKR